MGAHIISRGAEARVILDAIRRIVRELHQSSRSAEKALGLTAAQLFVLQKLAEAPGLSLNALAAETHTHQSSVSTVVSKLVERGLVLRGPSPQDARRLELRVSAEGRRIAGRTPYAAPGRLIQAIERLPDSRRRSLAASLAALTHAMELTAGEAVMFFDEPEKKGKRSHG